MLSAISWDPGFRGILVVLTGVVVLCGSVFLLLATNTGVRLGFLLALTGLFGWMTIMGIIWSMYGIGYKGPTPTWKVLDVNEGNIKDTPVAVARTLPEPNRAAGSGEARRGRKRLQKEFPPGPKPPSLGDLVTTDTQLADKLKERTGRWTLLPSSDKANGETAAAVATSSGRTSATCSPCRLTTSSRTRSPRAASRPAQIRRDRAHPAQAEDCVHVQEPAGLRRRAAAGRLPQVDEAWSAAAGAAADPNAAGDHGRARTRSRCAAASIGRLHRGVRHGLHHLRNALHRRDKAVMRARSGSRRSELSRWLSTCRSSRCWRWPWCSPP